MKESISQATHNALVQAAGKGNLSEVKRYLSEGADINVYESRDQGSNNAILAASENEHPDIVVWLVKQPGIDVNVRDRYFERTPLINLLIAGGEDQQPIYTLINNPNSDLTLRSPLEGSPLTLSIFHEEWDIARYILDKLSHYSDDEHPCALICAVRSEEPDLTLIEQLLSRGADPFWRDQVELPEHLYRDVYLHQMDESPFKRQDVGLNAIEVAEKYNKHIEELSLLVNRTRRGRSDPENSQAASFRPVLSQPMSSEPHQAGQQSTLCSPTHTLSAD